MKEDVIMEKLMAISDDLKSIKDTINGNGKPGLKTEVYLNTKFRDDTSGVLKGLTIKMLGFFLTNIILIVGLFYWTTH